MRRAFGEHRKPSMGSMSRIMKKGEGYSTMSMAIMLLGVVLIICAALYYKKPELFGNLFGTPKIKDLDVMFFMNPTCPWCKKMVDVMNKENTLNDVIVVDISKEEGQELAKKYGAINRGVPSFISRKLNTGTVGYKDSTKKIVSALTEGQSPKQVQEPTQVQEKVQGQKGQEGQGQNPIADMGIVMFMSESCGWCKKAKEEAAQNGVLPYLELQDINTPQGKAALGEMIGEGNFKGAPTFYSRKTGKVSVGYKPMDQLIIALQ